MGGRPIPIDSQALLREQAWVRALARSLVRDAGAAEDVVQETWLAALTRPPRGRERPEVRAFLATVVRRIAGAWRRGEALRAAREREASRREAVAPESDALEWLALQRRLADALAGLREPYRTALVMRYVEGLAPGEIARRLRESPQAVRTRLSRGLDMLRARLDRDFGGERGAWHAVLGGLVLRRGAGNAALASTLAGALMGWKTLAATAAVAAVLFGLWRSRAPERARPEPARASAPAERGPSSPEPLDASPLPARVAQDVRTAGAPTAAARPALSGRVASLADGGPLAGARVALEVETAERRGEIARRMQELEQAVARGGAESEDAGIEDLVAELEALNSGNRREESADDLATQCDSEGRFAFASLPAGEHALVARAEGHVATVVSAEELARHRGRELELALAPAGALDVEIVDESGAPLRDVRVAVRAERPLALGAARIEVLDALEVLDGGGAGFGPSDARGRVRAEPLPCGVELRVESRRGSGRADARRLATAAAAATIALAERRASVRLVLASAGGLTGLVRPAPAGGERVEARFVPRAAPRPGMATPAATAKPAGTAPVQPDGAFLLERLPAGPGRLEIATIRLGARATTSIGARRDVEVVPGELADAGVLELDASARVAGQVPGWGAATGDWFVELRFLREGRVLARTTLGDDGRFEAWLAPGRCALEVAHMGEVLGAVECSAPDDDLELDLLAFCAGLRGRVPEAERALTMLFAHLQPGDAADPARRISPQPLHAPLALRDGEFATLSLAPGRYSLLAPFGERGAAWVPRVELERGRVADVGELACGFGALRGRAVDERGEPVGGAEVTLSSPYAGVLRTFAERRATSAEDGRFEVEGLPAGPWLATARLGTASLAAALGASGVADVFPGASAEVEILVERAARLSVRVTRGGEPVAREALVLERAGGPERLELASSDDGAVELDALPGEWRWALGGEPPLRSGALSLSAGERRALEIELERHALRFSLAAELEGELAGAVAWRLDADGRGASSRSSAHDADGFVLDLAPGRWLVAALTRGAGSDGAALGVVDVPRDARALDFAPSEVSLTLRAADAALDASPPSAELVSVEGVPVEGWGIPVPLARVASGWRCASVPPGAELRVRGAAPGRGRAQRDARAPANGGVEIEWP